MMTILAMVAAGRITEDSPELGIMQGVTLEQAEAIADWLALATDSHVELQHAALFGDFTVIVRENAADARIKIRPVGEGGQ